MKNELLFVKFYIVRQRCTNQNEIDIENEWM